jgi:hypothetical protein
MTASLIDATAIAAIRASRAKTPESLLPSAPAGYVLSPERAERLTPKEWRRAWFKTVTFLDQHLIEVKATRKDGTGLDEAQRKVSEYRRQLEAASAQLTRDRAAHAEELARLTEQRTRECNATVNRERSARNELHQVQNDLRTAQSVIANLNAECERLEAQALTPVSTPLEVPPVTKQNTIKQMKCPTELGAMSPRAYLVAEGVENVQLDGRQVIWGKLIPLGVFEAWCGQYPTPAHQLAQLRAVIAKQALRNWTANS